MLHDVQLLQSFNRHFLFINLLITVYQNDTGVYIETIKKKLIVLENNRQMATLRRETRAISWQRHVDNMFFHVHISLAI